MTTRNETTYEVTACTACGHATIYAPAACLCGETNREVVELEELTGANLRRVEDEIAIEKTLAKFDR